MPTFIGKRTLFSFSPSSRIQRQSTAAAVMVAPKEGPREGSSKILRTLDRNGIFNRNFSIRFVSNWKKIAGQSDPLIEIHRLL
jgi:hypothetical protein